MTFPEMTDTTCVIPYEDREDWVSTKDKSEMKSRGMISEGPRGVRWRL